jgi:hypothetical protein
VLGVICLVTVAACGGGSSGSSTSGASNASSTTSDPPVASSLLDTALVADNATVVATVTTIDANLQNPWGIAVAAGLPFWIAAWAQDSGATAVTAYDDGIANGAQHAVYKGLALGTVNGATYLLCDGLFQQ